MAHPKAFIRETECSFPNGFPNCQANKSFTWLGCQHLQACSHSPTPPASLRGPSFSPHQKLAGSHVTSVSVLSSPSSSCSVFL